VEADDTYWNRLRAETGAMAKEHLARKPARKRPQQLFAFVKPRFERSAGPKGAEKNNLPPMNADERR
jgi:hypothetical protein